ncbi:MAG: T9SS type A sorting domain-containing protein [Ignavibacteriae bacterium]|nr:T9SS C-terminal target domain-containing protein [Ignavibacteriota bacterium]NOG98415.1 T9SS type A sorting domain-containing protein [Ignavibacteriota bacterium]
MKIVIFYSVFIFLAILPVTSQAQLDTLTILHISDTHSNLAPLAPRTLDLAGTQGGIARAATIVGQTKMTEPNVLFFHSGDLFVGDFFFNKYFGAAEFQLLNALGLDAMAIGNHEFDLMPSTLTGALQASFTPNDGFPLLCCNAVIEEDSLNDLKTYMEPYFIKELGSIKIGAFGLLTPATNLLSLPEPAFIDTNIFQHAVSSVEALTQEGCDVIVCLSHLGLGLDRLVAENIPGINLILGGHDHHAFDTPIEISNPAGITTYIIHSGAFYKSIGKIALRLNGGQVENVNFNLIELDESIPEEPTIAAQVNGMIAEIEADYGPVYSQQIGIADSFFEEFPNNLLVDGPHDTPVGNLVTDAFKNKTNTDIAIEPSGSTAQPIYKGPIVEADIFRTVGYGYNSVNGLGFRMVTFDLTGMQILGGLEFGLANIEEDDEFFIQASGLTYDYSPNNAPYSRLNYVLINGEPINPDSIYSVTTNEFVLAALDKLLGVVPQNIVLYDSLSEHQVVAEYVQNQGIIYPETGRITEVVDQNNIVPYAFELHQNYPNPFNPSTKISFSISEPGHTELNIYNILGENVITLLSETLTTGKYEISWNATGFASGVYFYTLKFNDVIHSKKMILMK